MGLESWGEGGRRARNKHQSSTSGLLQQYCTRPKPVGITLPGWLGCVRQRTIFPWSGVVIPLPIARCGLRSIGRPSVNHRDEKDMYQYSNVQGQDVQLEYILIQCLCVVLPFILDVRLVDAPAGVTQEGDHTGFLIHLPSAVLALIFIARRIQPSPSLVDREVAFTVYLHVSQLQ